MSHQHHLIDTTEMYLRTILELEEEGVVPLRARIAERLHQSGPTVSQTVARMERDGLLTVEGDRHLELTAHGRHDAIAVMRKHRLAELLLVKVIGLQYEVAHVEACRWEHVMSEEVERKVYELLGKPTVSPYGNDIPGLDELTDPDGSHTSGPASTARKGLDAAMPLTSVADNTQVRICRISEQLQTDIHAMTALAMAGIEPDAECTVSHQPAPDVDGVSSRESVTLTFNGRSVQLSDTQAKLVFVSVVKN